MCKLQNQKLLNSNSRNLFFAAFRSGRPSESYPAIIRFLLLHSVTFADQLIEQAVHSWPVVTKRRSRPTGIVVGTDSVGS